MSLSMDNMIHSLITGHSRKMTNELLFTPSPISNQLLLLQKNCSSNGPIVVTVASNGSQRPAEIHAAPPLFPLMQAPTERRGDRHSEQTLHQGRGDNSETLLL